MSIRTVKVGSYVTEDVNQMLLFLARAEKRTKSGMIEVLIIREFEKYGKKVTWDEVELEDGSTERLPVIVDSEVN
jgi:hypothetical protein